ncbi:MAG: 50S ribosomal protein L6 [Parcubacteria group bacterium]|nr:50S ribosomal protein L6 [Parcubacteria group bacterium]
MSRIAKKPLLIPEKVSVKREDDIVIVEGPKGKLEQKIDTSVIMDIKPNEIFFSNDRESKKKQYALLGLSYRLVGNMILGVTAGFSKKLELVGIGYTAQLSGNTLTLLIGFSHPVTKVLPLGISASVEKNTITISGIDKWLVGNTAAHIRKLRPPEPYKGTGIRYSGEVIIKKAGKKALAAGAAK